MKVIFLTIQIGNEIKHILCYDSLLDVQNTLLEETGKQYSLKECNAFITDYKINRRKL